LTPWPKLTTAARIVAVTDLRDAGHTKAEIAAAFSITPNALHGFCYRHQIPGVANRPKTGWYGMTNEQRAEHIQAANDNGKLTSETAKELGITPAALRHFAWRNNMRGISEQVVVVRRGGPPEVPADPVDPAVWQPLPGQKPSYNGTGCQWPIDGHGRAFCGAKKRKRSHYCEAHYAIAYKPARKLDEKWLASLDARGGKKIEPVVVAHEGKKEWRSEDE